MDINLKNLSCPMTRYMLRFHSYKFSSQAQWPWFNERSYLGRVARKTVLVVSEQVIPKPACSATEPGYKIEISHVASFDMILITQTLVRLRGCASWSAPLLISCNKIMFISRRAHFKLDTSDLGRFSINLPKAWSSSSSLSCSRCFLETSRAFPAEKRQENI